MTIGGEPKPITHNETLNLMKSLSWKISGPFYTVVPTPKTEYIERCAEDVEALTDYLVKAVVIEDGIVEHNERRAIEKQHPAIGEFSSKYSKLGLNIINNILSFHLGEIIEQCRRINKEKGEKLNKIADLPNWKKRLYEYRNLDFRGKVAFVKELDTVIYRFLEELSK